MNINRSTAINNINTYKQNLNKPNNNYKNISMKKDTIEISKEARKISAKLSNNNEVVSYEKIESIKKSIQDGTYTINYDKLAEKILDKMRG